VCGTATILMKLLSESRHVLTLSVSALLVALAIAETVAYQRIQTLEPDSSYYLGLSEALLSTHQYVFNDTPHTLYPPGFPLMIAACKVLFGDSYRSTLLLMPAMGLVGMMGAFALLGRMQGLVVASVITVVVALSPATFSHSTRLIASDVPYFALSMLALLLIDYLSGAHGWRAAAASALLIPVLALATLVRSAGISLFVATLLYSAVMWWQKQRFIAFRLLPALLLCLTANLLWHAWTSGHAADSKQDAFNSYSYQLRMKDFHEPDAGTASMKDYSARLVTNLPYLGSGIAQFALSDIWVDARWSSPVVMIPLVLLFFGWLHSMIFRPSIADYYSVLYIGICLIWWLSSDAERFLLPIVPILLLYCYRGFLALSHWAERTGGLRRVAPALLCLAGVALIAVIMEPRPVGRQRLLTPLLWCSLAGGIWLATKMGNWRMVIAVGTAALVLIFDVVGIVAMAKANLHPDPRSFPQYSSMVASAWIEQHTPYAAVVMADQDSLIRYATRRRTVHLPITSNVDAILNRIRTNGVQYVVVIDSPAPFFRPPEGERVRLLLSRYPDALKPVYEAGQCRIFEVPSKGVR
jgi:hypothetical protein